MKPLLGSLIFVLGLLAPATLTAQDRADNHSRQTQRYYDKQNKDWHEWNDGENQAYQRYTQENKRPNRDFHRLPKRQQQTYFQWRHQHMDDHANTNR